MWIFPTFGNVVRSVSSPGHLLWKLAFPVRKTLKRDCSHQHTLSRLKKINKTRSWCSSTRVLFRVPRLCLFFTPVGYRELIKFGTYGNIAKLNCVHSDVLLNFVFWPVVEFLAVCGRGPGELGRESRRESGMNSKGDFDIFLWYTDKIFRLVQFLNFNIQVEFFQHYFPVLEEEPFSFTTFSDIFIYYNLNVM